MRSAFNHAAVAAFLATGLVAGASGQMQTPPSSTAPNGARVPPSGNSTLPAGPPSVRAKPGDPLAPPSELTPNAPRYAETPGASARPDAPTATPPATTQQGDSRARAPADSRTRAPAHRAQRDDTATRRDDTGTHRGPMGTRADTAAFPPGLRECADKVDRDERARCAHELYESSGRPKP